MIRFQAGQTCRGAALVTKVVTDFPIKMEIVTTESKEANEAEVIPADTGGQPRVQSELISQWEEENSESLGVRVGPHNLVVNECEFVDNQLAVCKDNRAARIKGDLITLSMELMNIDAHPVKTRYMIVGKEEYVKEMETKLQEDPIVIQGFRVERTFKENTCLGIILNSGGARATGLDQMEFKVKKCDAMGRWV